MFIPQRTNQESEEAIVHPGDVSSIFEVLILHFNNWEGVRMLPYIIAEVLGLSRKKFQA